MLLKNPNSGDVIKHSGGLRKIRYLDSKRSKGKRLGLRIIYYYYKKRDHFWLITLYEKNGKDDLSYDGLKLLKSVIETIKTS